MISKVRNPPQVSATDASPFLLFSLLGMWGAVFLIRNYFRDGAFHTFSGRGSVRPNRIYKSQMPGWFLALTVLYLAMAGLFIVGPIWFVASLMKH